MSSRYTARGPEAEFQPGSRGRVLRNLLGLQRVRHVTLAESQALQLAQDAAADGNLRTDYRADLEASRFQWAMKAWSEEGFHAPAPPAKGRRIPSTAEDV